MFCSRIIFAAMLAVLGACSTGPVESVDTVGRMVSVDADGKRTNYSKYYDLGVWLEEGKLGLQVVIDHGPLPNPRLVIATGTVTLYLVNLETRPRQIRGLSVVTNKNEKSLPLESSALALQRARTRVPLGTIPIFDYGKEVPLTITIEVDGSPPKIVKLIVPRITEQQAFWLKGPPPYPWFKAPYFPFDPPLSIAD
jgi:hypothetical protein